MAVPEGEQNQGGTYLTKEQWKVNEERRKSDKMPRKRIIQLYFFCLNQ
jgi:hypothetical protein